MIGSLLCAILTRICRKHRRVRIVFGQPAGKEPEPTRWTYVQYPIGEGSIRYTGATPNDKEGFFTWPPSP